MQDNELTDEEMEDAVADLDDSDLQERSQALDDAQTMFEELAYLANPKMPCPECTGAGAISAGSLGDVCPRCLGRRVVDRPGTEPLKQPDFKQLRSAITAYGDAKADRLLEADHDGKRNLALPAPSSVPTMADIEAIVADGKEFAKQLGGTSPGLVANELLSEPEKPKGMLGDGDLGDYEDEDLDALEAETK